MRTSLPLLTLFITFLSVAQQGPVSVSFHKNVELAGYIIHLVDPSDNDPAHPISRELNRWPEDKDLPVLAEILQIAGDMPYNFLIDLFYALPEFPLDDTYELPMGRLKKYGYETDSEVSSVRNLIERTREFSRISNFEKVWTSLEPYRQETLLVLEANKPSARLIAAIESYYERAFTAYQIVPSLTLWSGPGWGGHDDDHQAATFILGPLGKNYDYSDGVRFANLAIHEFGHSFVNEVVLENGELIRRTEALFEPIRESMIRQGYSDWKTCLIEHFVRAGEVILSDLSGDLSAGKRLREDYAEQRQFIYLPFLVDRLNEYRTSQHFSYREAVFRALVDLEREY